MFRPLCLIVLFLSCGVAAAQQEYKRMPWHLVDIWWDTGETVVFESYSIDVTISQDIPSTVNLYIAPIGLGKLSGTSFYGGLQTQADGNTRENPRLRKIGPGFLMSMWGERSRESIRPSEGGYFQSSGHEGDFVSVRRPYEWSRGTYTYRIVRMDQETVDDQTYTWVGAFVYSHEKDENIFVGALRFPGEALKLDRQIASFVEVYGRAIPVEQIPKVLVTFGNLRVNGQPVENPGATAIYPKGVPDYAEAIAEKGQLVIEVGQKVEGRQVRQIKLLPMPE